MRRTLVMAAEATIRQVLSYTSLQVETAAQLALGGRGEAAAAQLARLGEVVREGHADLRE
jgi:signal transduction histidine kinase